MTLIQTIDILSQYQYSAILTAVQLDIARVILRKEGWRSLICPTTAGMQKGFLSPFSSLRGAHAIFAPLFVSSIVYCQPRFVSHEAIPRIPSGPSSSVRPIWPALGELSTGAGNRGVLGTWLICISMALLLVDGLPSRWTLSFIESDKRK